MSKQGLVKKLFNTTIVYFIANFSTKILSFLLLPLYTSKLTPGDYGRVDIVFTLAQFLMPVLTLNLTAAAFRYLVDAKERSDKTKIISTAFYAILLNVVIALVIVIIIYIFNREKLILLGALYIMSSAICSFFLQICRGIDKSKTYAIMGVFNAFLHIVLNIVFVIGFIEKSFALLISPIIASLSTSIIILLLSGVYKYIKIKTFDKKCFSELFKFAAPMIPEQLIWWFLTGFSKLYLSQVHGEQTLGIYTVASKFSDLLISIYSIFHLAWVELAYSIYGEQDKDKLYSIAYNKIATAMLSIVMLLIPITKLSISFFLNETYHVGIVYMPVLYLMAFINILSTYYGTGFQSAKKTNGVFVSSLIGALVNVSFCLVLVPLLKIWGTIISLLTANITLLVSKKIISKKFFRIKVDYKWLLLLVPTLLFIGVYYYGGIMANILTLCVGIVITVIANMEILKSLINNLKKKKQRFDNEKFNSNS